MNFYTIIKVHQTLNIVRGAHNMAKKTKGENCINRNICKVVKKTRNELRSILKDFHYKSETQQMSKDVVVALENLVGDLK